ncbi:MAG: hypothetical protein COA79_12225 [Planctomycetota bacterium]|nr:MAG: hypothetical protein COA79_12225 [Planctomycetota bacterium]
MTNSKLTINFAHLLKKYIEDQSEQDIAIFFKEIHGLLYRVAWSFLKNSADAEDVLQMAFIKIIQNIHQCKGLKEEDNESIQAWCVSIVRNLSRMKLRSHKSRERRNSKVSEKIKPFTIDENEIQKSENRAEVSQRLETVLMELPEKYRVAIHLKFIEGMNYKEMSAALAVNTDTLRVQVKRGLEKLSLSLKKIGIVASIVSITTLLPKMPLHASPKNIDSLIQISLQSKSHTVLETSTTMQSIKIYLILPILLATIVTISSINSSNITNFFSTLISNQSNEIINQPKKEQFISWKWDFKNGEGKEVELVRGKWAFNNKRGTMSLGVNKAIVIKLPVHSIQTNFVIEYDLALFKRVNADLASYGRYSANEFFLECEYIALSKNNVKRLGTFKGKSYFYKNYIIKTFEGKINDIVKYQKRPKDYDLFVVLKTFDIKRIQVKAIKSIPAFVKNKIKDLDESEMVFNQTYHVDRLKTTY